VWKIEGVSTATVNLASEKLFVEFIDAQTLFSVKKAVVKIGYEVLDKSKGVTALQKLFCPQFIVTVGIKRGNLRRIAARLNVPCRLNFIGFDYKIILKIIGAPSAQ
jgi:hypothetical protein